MAVTQITYIESPVGSIKVASDGKSITEILFIQESHKADKPKGILKDCVNQLKEYFKGERKVFDLPLAQIGSEFQQNVWQQLMNIPFGKTTSYIHIAMSLGDDKLTRAVGSANGKNNISIVVPCHRVIGSDGKLTGYAGGLWRKQWLLEHELKYAHGVQQLF